MARREEVVKKFDKMAAFYDLGLFFLTLPVGGERALRRKVLAVAQIREGEHLLEMGCGTGSNLVIAAESTSISGKVTGIDPSRQMLAKAAKKTVGRGEISLVNASDAALFSDASFDVVVYFLVLHELPLEVRLQSLREAFRVLKPGGRLLVADFGLPKKTWVNRLFRFALRFEEEEASDYVARGLVSQIKEAVPDSLEVKKTEDFLGGILQVTVLTKLHK